MHVLSVVHGQEVRTELFMPVVRERDHAIDEWGFAWGSPPPRPLDAYDAVLLLGGAMHADQDAWHPWLREETLWLEQLLARRVPTFGICLGVQLLARAAGSWVGPLAEPEIGWYPVELTEEGAADPVLGSLPRAFEAFQWHYYTHGLPAGAIELARSAACTQAFRLGDACWGIQFHPEVTETQLAGWIDDPTEHLRDRAGLRAETAEKIGGWNALGRTLCGAFVDTADRLLTHAA